MITWLAGYAKTSASPQPTSIVQTINNGIQVFGDLVGGNKSAGPAINLDPQNQPMPESSTKIQFPLGTLDRLAFNTSLLDGATWSLTFAPGNRNLRITFDVEAEQAGEGTGLVTARLIDSSNVVVCTSTINSATSRKTGKIFSGSCQVNNYFSPANTPTVFHAEVKSDAAKVLRVALGDVVAMRR